MKKVFLITINLLIVFNTNTCCFRPKPKIHPKDDIVNIFNEVCSVTENGINFTLNIGINFEILCNG